MKNIFSKFLSKKKNRSKLTMSNTNEFGGIIAPSNPIALVDEPVTFTSTVDFTDANVVGINTGGNWEITGNTGTDEATNFIGTVDSRKFLIRTNNTKVAEFPISEFGSIIVGKNSFSNSNFNVILGNTNNFNNNGTGNIIIGKNIQNTSGNIGNSSYNIILGNDAGSVNRSSYNVLQGFAAAQSITQNANDNVIIGPFASASTGNPRNLAIGMSPFTAQDGTWTQIDSVTWQKTVAGLSNLTTGSYIPYNSFSYNYQLVITRTVTTGNFQIVALTQQGQLSIATISTSGTGNFNLNFSLSFALRIIPSADFTGTVSLNLTHTQVDRINHSVIIGSSARPKDNDDINEIVIGRTAIGGGSNTVTIGNNSIIDTFLKGNLNLAGYGLGNITGTITRLLGVTTDGKVVEKVQPKVYVAKVVFSGEINPTATVLENTLDGTPVWTRESQGTYRVTLASAFALNKTFVTHNQVDATATNNTRQTVNTHSSADFIAITNGVIGSSTDETADITADAMYIEIRVYP